MIAISSAAKDNMRLKVGFIFFSEKWLVQLKRGTLLFFYLLWNYAKIFFCKLLNFFQRNIPYRGKYNLISTIIPINKIKDILTGKTFDRFFSSKDRIG